jgi:hypothetical protein
MYSGVWPAHPAIDASRSRPCLRGPLPRPDTPLRSPAGARARAYRSEARLAARSACRPDRPCGTATARCDRRAPPGRAGEDKAASVSSARRAPRRARSRIVAGSAAEKSVIGEPRVLAPAAGSAVFSNREKTPMISTGEVGPVFQRKQLILRNFGFSVGDANRFRVLWRSRYGL